MDFHLTKEQLLVRKMYRDFAENEVKPLAAEIDEEERFPMETVEKMAKLGMMGIYFPKEYGGAGADVLSYAMCVEELAKVCGTTAVIVSAHTSLCAAPIFENGTEEQKMKYLPDLCSGKKIGAFGLTEPGAGTDAQGQQTTAVLDESGENYILNGSKCFITNGNVADTFVVIAVTGKTVDKRGRSMKEKESSHRQSAGDLGVRVQTGGMTSDPTARKAINNVITREALINCDFSGNVLDGVDQAEVYIRDAYILRDMRKDYNLFNSQLGILGTEKETFTKYLQKEKTISDIAEDQGITYESARQQMQKIKVRMKKQVKRFMDGQPGGIA